MPQPGESSRPRSASEDAYLELLAETLSGLDPSVRGPFLSRFFKTISQVELDDAESLKYWDEMLRRREELSLSLRSHVSLKTSMLDVLASINYLRVPILMEYEDYKKLQVNAATDPLTGLYNRRLFEEYSEKELNRTKRYGQHLALVILDLHRFKEVNDRYGHMQGDVALQVAASTIRKTIRASDFAFRLGGDEFALLLPQADPEQAAALCQRLRVNYDAGIRDLHFEVPLALDFGVAVYPQDGDLRDSLLKIADERLYRHKQGSRTAPLEPSGEPPASRHFSREAPREGPGRIPPPTAQHTPESAPQKPAPPSSREQSLPHEFFSSAPPTPPSAVAGRASGAAENRKWERVALAGTRAYAVLDSTQRTAGVMDLSYGGVALAVDHPEDLAATFSAVLHVPILPPVRVTLRRVYSKKLLDSQHRIGCAFVS
ncbi:MAG: diguanylate cyclase [Candidatus Acidiferrales bacterium]